MGTYINKKSLILKAFLYFFQDVQELFLKEFSVIFSRVSYI